jgi:hypothetical protein
MTTTLDGSTLTVLKWAESVTTEASQWDAWSGSVYKRKVKVYGIVRVYTITFVEQGVMWSNSLALKFENDAANGNTVQLYSTEAYRPINPAVNVYITDVNYTLENLAGNNIRTITVTVQEAQ